MVSTESTLGLCDTQAGGGKLDGMSEDTEQVKRLLAGLRYPAIPEHLADRIDAAVSAEAAIRAGRVIVGSISRPELAQQAAKARAESKMLREDVTMLAGLVSETEDAMATTMDKLASQHPDHAEILGELSRAARLGATRATALA
jgi:hypothetical protein